MSPTPEITAFCATCPEADAITTFLASLGLHLTYTHPAENDQEYLDLPPLPAQYHYEDDLGTQVLFLAGQDTPGLADDEDEEVTAETFFVRKSYPSHASRFWLIAGAHELATYRVQDALAERWSLNWLYPQEVSALEMAA